MYQLKDKPEEKQYQFEIDGHIAKIEYIKTQKKIYLTHTEVPSQLKGKGVGSALVKQVLEDIEPKGLDLVPLCPFVAAYIKRHPEWKKLLLEGVNLK